MVAPSAICRVLAMLTASRQSGCDMRSVSSDLSRVRKVQDLLTDRIAHTF